MNEIRIQKIDGQEFVPLKDYQKLKEKIETLEKYKAELEGYVDEIDEYKNKRLNKIAEYQNLSF